MDVILDAVYYCVLVLVEQRLVLFVEVLSDESVLPELSLPGHQVAQHEHVWMIMGLHDPVLRDQVHRHSQPVVHVQRLNRDFLGEVLLYLGDGEGQRELLHHLLELRQPP